MLGEVLVLGNMRKNRLYTLVVGLLLAVLLGWFWDHRHYWLSHNLRAVESGRIYRSGYQYPGPLARIVNRYGIKTVLSLRRDQDELDAKERDVLRAHGIRLRRIVIKGEGEELLDRVGRAAAILADPDQQPILVHCWRGRDRTGAVVALYRVAHGGWNPQAAHRELERLDVPRTGARGWPHRVLDAYCNRTAQTPEAGQTVR